MCLIWSVRVSGCLFSPSTSPVCFFLLPASVVSFLPRALYGLFTKFFFFLTLSERKRGASSGGRNPGASFRENQGAGMAHFRKIGRPKSGFPAPPVALPAYLPTPRKYLVLSRSFRGLRRPCFFARFVYYGHAGRVCPPSPLVSYRNLPYPGAQNGKRKNPSRIYYRRRRR